MSDQALIARFSTDPAGAYHDLLARYSDVLLRMIRRFIQDPDEVMEVYTTICERLRANDYLALRRFHTATTLQPWLSIVVANACRDRFRKTRAMSVPQAVLDRLSERERLVFKYYYQEHQRHEDIAQRIAHRHGLPCTALEVVRDVARIDALLTTGRRWFLIAALNANRPALSLDVLREETGYQPTAHSEFGSFEEALDQQERVEMLNTSLEQLAPNDRLLILLRFEHGLTAPQIAGILGYENHRQVYTRLRTVFNQLRVLMGVE